MIEHSRKVQRSPAIEQIITPNFMQVRFQNHSNPTKQKEQPNLIKQILMDWVQ